MHVNIIVATPLHADVITRLSQITFTETFAHCNSEEDMAIYIANDMSHERINGELLNPDNTFFIAFVNDIPAGFAKVRSSKNPAELAGQTAMEIERLYVLAEYHGHKIGAALMQHCLDTANRSGFNTVWLGVWEHNQKAIAFYQRWGFTFFGQHIFTLGTDDQTDLLMKRPVTLPA